MNNHFSEIKITVVIPVYNAERYISRCLESLQAQTLRDLEFLFINDCTPDDSMKPVVEWADRDPRVRIIHNEQNLGAGGSRNRGITAARGLYINTIDPDDWVAPDYYELLWAKALETSADIVKGTRIKVDEETMKELASVSSLNETISAGLSRGEPLYLHFHYEHTTMIFKRSLLNENVRYGKSPNACDTTFLLRLCANTNSCAFENRANYYYLQRPDSASAGYSFDRSRNELVSLREQLDYFRRGGSMDEYAYAYCAGKIYAYSARYVHACESESVSSDEKARYVSDLKAQITSLPDYPRLYKYVPEIFAIVRLDMVPAPRLNTDFSVFRAEIADWMAFVSAFDKSSGDPAHSKLENLLAAYFNKRHKSGASKETIEREIAQVRDELRPPDEGKEFELISDKALKRILGTGLRAKAKEALTEWCATRQEDSE